MSIAINSRRWKCLPNLSRFVLENALNFLDNQFSYNCLEISYWYCNKEHNKNKVLMFPLCFSPSRKLVASQRKKLHNGTISCSKEKKRTVCFQEYRLPTLAQYISKIYILQFGTISFPFVKRKCYVTCKRNFFSAWLLQFFCQLLRFFSGWLNSIDTTE